MQLPKQSTSVKRSIARGYISLGSNAAAVKPSQIDDDCFSDCLSEGKTTNVCLSNCLQSTGPTFPDSVRPFNYLNINNCCCPTCYDSCIGHKLSLNNSCQEGLRIR
ncbi:MAG: hypothetical protein ACFCU7_18615 [Pleurocapsa sp.]